MIKLAELEEENNLEIIKLNKIADNDCLQLEMIRCKIIKIFKT